MLRGVGRMLRMMSQIERRLRIKPVAHEFDHELHVRLGLDEPAHDRERCHHSD